MKPLLSICMIVKNEEKVIGRCLESIHGIADEIIVVDTGSEDQTKDIALRYTDKLFDLEWENDFSKARNHAASKAAGEWIFVLDADEYVDRESFKRFKESLKDNPPVHNILSVQIVSFIGNNGKDTSMNYHERLYRNDPSISYYRSVHEQLMHKEGKEDRGVIDLHVYHSGYMQEAMEEKNKTNRNLDLLLSKEKEPIDYFFIGNEYNIIGELDKAILNYQKAYQLENNVNLNWVKKLLLHLADSLHKAKREREALEIIESCEQIYTNLVDFTYYKGKLFFDTKQYKKAKAVFEDILLRKDSLSADSSMDFLELLPLKYLGDIYERENELHKAVKSYSKALTINETDDELWTKLISLLAKHSSLEELSGFLNNNMVNKKSMTPLRVAKILLAVPDLNVQRLSRSLLDEPELSIPENKALLMKNLQLDQCYEDILELVHEKSASEMVTLLATGIFSIIDLILLAVKTDDNQCKTVLLDIQYDQPLTNLYQMLFSKKNKKLSSLEESFYISLYKQAQLLQEQDIVKLLRSRRSFLSKDGKKLLNEIDGLYAI